MNQRIIGIDVARALALFGMITVNFKVVLGSKGAPWLQALAGFMEGKAAATFVVLAGVGLAFMTRKALETHDREKLKRAYRRILKRALFLFVLGLSYLWIWPTDILHFYGIYMLLALFFVPRENSWLWVGMGGGCCFHCLEHGFPILRPGIFKPSPTPIAGPQKDLFATSFLTAFTR